MWHKKIASTSKLICEYMRVCLQVLMSPCAFTTREFEHTSWLLTTDCDSSQTKTVCNILMRKHPRKQLLKQSSIITADPEIADPHPILLDRIDGPLIYKHRPQNGRVSWAFRSQCCCVEMNM